MDAETYYRDHWVTIEPERLERYKKTLRITDANRSMLVEPLGAQPGETVVDFGCGPGYVTAELAEVVGADGLVHGVDLNPDLLGVASTVAAEAGVADRVRLHQAGDATIPLPDASVDRVVFKSVLLYVPDVDATLAEARRVLRPGGKVVAQDTDFWLSACTAFSREEWRAFLDAIRPAFRDPTMGRNLRGALRRAGFAEVTTSASALVDDKGFFRSTVENFFGYAREVDTLSEAAIADMARRADQAIEDGDWLFVLNFFLCTATR